MQIWRVGKHNWRAAILMSGRLLGDLGPSVLCDVLKNDNIELVFGNF